jgi:hypothetical protein
MNYVLDYPGIYPEILKQREKNHGKITVWKEAITSYIVSYPFIRLEILKKTEKTESEDEVTVLRF